MAWFFGIALMGAGQQHDHPDVRLDGPAPLYTLLNITSNLPDFYIILVMLVLIYVVLKQVTKSPYGLAFSGIGKNIDAVHALWASTRPSIACTTSRFRALALACWAVSTPNFMPR